MEYRRSSLSSGPRRRPVSIPRISWTNIIHGHHNSNIGNVSESFNNVTNVVVYEDPWWIQGFRAWLSPLEPHRRHQDVSNERVGGVGDWVLGRSEFKSWSGGQGGATDPTLLCYGDPGVGKTYISSLVIDTLRDRTREQNTAVLCLYCDYQPKAQKEQSAVNMIGGLLRQVHWEAIGIRQEIRSAFNESKRRGGQGLRMPDMLKFFVRVISSIDQVYLCVDGVDELLPENRSEFLRALRQIIQDVPNTRLFLTTRLCIRKELSQHLSADPYSIKIVADQGDVARYLNHKMDNDRDPGIMPADLRKDIMSTILGKASEMFLLVVLSISAILGETSLAGRRRMLGKVAATGLDLDSVYSQTLRRIETQEGDRSKLGIEVLMWVSHSERPLRIDELQNALAVNLETIDLDPENIRSEDVILGSCLGLVVVDRKTLTVQPIHHTLQEYLSGPGILPDAHRTLAQTCLAYLNSDRVKGLPANWIPNPRDMPFFEYSSIHWGSHARIDLSDRAKSLALELLTRYDSHVSATLLFNQMQSYDSPPVIDHLFAGLHCASYFGIVEIVAVLIKKKLREVNQGDCKGSTPLMWAAQRGNEAVVTLLLERRGIKTNKPDNSGQTPLWRTSSNGQERVVSLLLKRRGVKINKPDNSGQTPLWCASSNGHERVVSLLLRRRDIKTNQPDNSGQTPLWCASLNGHEGVVRLLAGRGDVNPDVPDNHGRTLLWWASGSGKKEVVSQLLTRDDVDPERPDSIGRTPLQIARVLGHREIVAILQDRITRTSSTD